MKLPWTTKLSLLIYKHITGPITDGLVNAGQAFFVWLDKKMDNEVAPISFDKELREIRSQMKLDKNNVPDELHHLIPVALKWGIGDDSVRGELVDGATDDDKQALSEALDGKLEIVDEWLLVFSEGAMTEEAAAFMYMAEAVEEMGLKVCQKR